MKTNRFKFRMISMMLIVFILWSQAVWALPQDGNVAGGNATITQPDSATMHINQTTDKAIINWQGYSIAANEKVQYSQPSSGSISLNRVIGADPSYIYGQLSANGGVWVINPNGLLIGNGANIDVGSFLGSTLNLGDEDFMDGEYSFRQEATGNGLSVITNLGNITAQNGGYIVLLSPSITNEGTVTSNLGKTYLASGDDVTLNFAGNGLIGFTIGKGTLGSLAGITNRGTITANGGEAILSAKAAGDLFKTVINNQGVIEAQTIENKNGVIKLVGGMEDNSIKVGGTLDASAPGGGDGGFIETSAAKVKIEDNAKITTYAPNGVTGTWLIDPQDYTIAASGGDITGAALSSNLDSNNVTILSSSGGASGNGDVFVNDAVSWSANTLTLTAVRNIEINAVMDAAGTAGLSMNTGGGGAVKVGFNDGGATGFKGKVNLATGTSLTINGDVYTIINSLGAAGSATGTDLQGMSGNLAGKYALGSDIDASATSGWNGGDGFMPVGAFTGIFDGLGHTITGLTINRPAAADVGFFGYANGAAIRNVGLADSDITGYDYVGGLAGRTSGATVVSNSYNTGTVTGNNYYTGGLIGHNFGAIDGSYNAAVVNGNWTVGGVVGENSGGALNASYNTGAISGRGNVGGLMGQNSNNSGGASGTGTINNSYNFGNVSSTVNGVIGGLAGNNQGAIANSYNTGSVTGNAVNEVGGLVGSNYSVGTISNAYSTGSVSGNFSVGGLAGINHGASAISNSYATGAVTGAGWYTGGLVGFNDNGTIGNSYSTGAVTNTGWYTGGLVGYNNNGTIADSRWNTETSGMSNCVGTGSNPGCTGLTAAQMKQQASFSGWDFTDTWLIYEDNTYPLLRYSLAPLTVLANDLAMTYDGQAYSGGNGVTYLGFSGGDTSAALGGALTYGGDSQGATNAGSYTITPGGYWSDSYNITYVNGILTVAPRELSLTGLTADNKVYDGTAGASISSYGSLSGIVEGDTVTLESASASANFDNKNAGEGKTVTVTGLAVDNGNYSIGSQTTTADISRTSLTVTAGNDGKTYDGAAYSGGNGVSYSGFVAGEDESALGGMLTYGGTSQGAVDAGSYSITPSGLTSGNYAITFADATLTISPAPDEPAEGSLIVNDTLTRIALEGLSDNAAQGKQTSGRVYMIVNTANFDDLFIAEESYENEIFSDEPESCVLECE